ncbi:rhodanese-related sulfurtransferase [Rhodobium orientis]|nr:rhodanese-like domain-containing protein [Rhodobium orientis]MBB4301535.1 rhodanese-related sulfurtransferase [Rhodobium orientis]
MALTAITPEEASKLRYKNGVIIDIREPAELVRERIPDSRALPLSQIATADLKLGPKERPIFICHSGARTNARSGQLAAKIKGQGYALTGGMVAWKKAGLPVITPDDAASKRARLVLNVLNGITLGGLALAGYGFVTQGAIVGVIGAGLAITALFGRGPAISAVLGKHGIPQE